MNFRERIAYLRIFQADIEHIVSKAATKIQERGVYPSCPTHDLRPIKGKYRKNVILDKIVEISYIASWDKIYFISVPFDAFDDIDSWINEQLEEQLVKTKREEAKEQDRIARVKEDEIATLKILREKYPEV